MENYKKNPKEPKVQESVASVEKKNGAKPDIKIINLILMAVNPFLVVYILKFAPTYVQYVLPYLKADLAINNLESKVQFALYFAIYFAALMQVFIFTTIFFRVVKTRPNPVIGQDPPIIITCMKVLQNSLEQFVIFAPNWLYYLFVTAQPTEKNTLITWAVLFIISRAAFGFGYIIGSQVRVSLLRQLGFLVGMCLNVALLLQNTGVYNTLSFIS